MNWSASLSLGLTTRGRKKLLFGEEWEWNQSYCPSGIQRNRTWRGWEACLIHHKGSGRRENWRGNHLNAAWISYTVLSLWSICSFCLCISLPLTPFSSTLMTLLPSSSCLPLLPCHFIFWYYKPGSLIHKYMRNFIVGERFPIISSFTLFSFSLTSFPAFLHLVLSSLVPRVSIPVIIETESRDREQSPLSTRNIRGKIHIEEEIQRWNYRSRG